MHRIKLCLAILVSLSAAVVHALGVERAIAPDPDDKPLSLRIWYPNDSQHADAVLGEHLPLVVISHGAGGDNGGHEDTARALAAAGFVVAAVTHTGDNYRDQSYVHSGTHLVGRPRHVARNIDYMLTAWHAHRQLDAERIGVFGFSVGGFAALVLAGGQPNVAPIASHCRQVPMARECEYLSKNDVAVSSIQLPTLHDARVKASAPRKFATIRRDSIGLVFTIHSMPLW
ncbi:MAG TPA: dienelactone hydrolase family protein [Spongiibacteraceae bacterium]|nr:dienelactone hydrolase family protein [Spongiibacteraceae bacterium]